MKEIAEKETLWQVFRKSRMGIENRKQVYIKLIICFFIISYLCLSLGKHFNIPMLVVGGDIGIVFVAFYILAVQLRRQHAVLKGLFLTMLAVVGTMLLVIGNNPDIIEPNFKLEKVREVKSV